MASVVHVLTDVCPYSVFAAVMCKFKHPNIIKLYGVVSHLDLAYIVMELAPHGQVRIVQAHVWMGSVGG